jgi:PhnB protein
MEKQIREGMHALSPHLVCAGAADAIDFYKKAFGAKEMVRLAGPNGKLLHACISINGSSVMLLDENEQWGVRSPKALGGTPVTIHLIVEDADKAAVQAVAAGAKVIKDVSDTFWGDRYGVVEDPFGHHWSIATPQRHVSEAELKETVRKMFAESTPG